MSIIFLFFVVPIFKEMKNDINCVYGRHWKETVRILNYRCNKQNTFKTKCWDHLWMPPQHQELYFYLGETEKPVFYTVYEVLLHTHLCLHLRFRSSLYTCESYKKRGNLNTMVYAVRDIQWIETITILKKMHSFE